MKHDSESTDGGKDLGHLLVNCQVIRCSAGAVLLAAVLLCTQNADAFRVIDVSGFGLGVARWNAAPHFVDGVERSLDGGLRYSVSGGSYEALRDSFFWEGTPPSVPDFQRAVEQAFAVWEAVDPATGLGTELRFVPDFGTPVFAEPVPAEISGLFRLNRGAEIDILPGQLEFPVLGRAELFGDANASVTLTSGVTDYAPGAFSGVDIYMDSSFRWNLELFQGLLSHEIGHAIGLGDVDAFSVAPGEGLTRFYDDNYDNTSPATAEATLTNSFASLIDPLDPDNSPSLMLYDVCAAGGGNAVLACTGNPGIDTPGVEILMEGSPTSPNFASLSYPTGLQNDDFAGRQFLYPVIRTPGDFDGDTLLTIQDIDLLSAEIIAAEPRLWFDLNDDDSVDANDLSFWVTDLKETFIGDADLDGQVGAADLNSLALNWRADDATSWTQGDFNGDGNVNAVDLNSLALNWRSSVVQAATVVPEPSTTVLLLVGSTVMLIGRRRRIR